MVRFLVGSFGLLGEVPGGIPSSRPSPVVLVHLGLPPPLPHTQGSQPLVSLVDWEWDTCGTA